MTRTRASARAAGSRFERAVADHRCNQSTRAKEDPTEGHPRRRPVRERLLARCVTQGDCLVWTGAVRHDNGYGVIGLVIDGRHVTKSTHRVAYEEFVGPIPDGYHLDHLCSNRLCVNGAHLEAVPQAVNNLRMKANHRVTHCKRGHEFTDVNTMPTARGRNCRTCHNARNQARRNRERVAA